MKTKTIYLCSFVFILIFFSVVILTGSILSLPHQNNIGEPSDKLKAEKVLFPSKSGSNISGWFIPGKNNMGGILLLHGLKSNRLQMMKRAEFLNENGYSILMIDFQSHGESIGDGITFGYLEALDAEAAFTFLENKLPNNHIGVIGVSLGGAAALLGQVAEKSKAIIIESVYPTIEEAIKNRLVRYLGKSGKYLSPLLILQIKYRLNIDINRLHPIERIKNIKGAVLVICGSADKYTTLAESERMFEQAKEPKQFWVVNGAAHVDFSCFDENHYKTKVLSFFKQYL